MAEAVKIQLTGWKAVAAILVVIAIVAGRLLTLGDKTDDAALMRALKGLLMCDYMPNEADRLRKAVESGDDKLISSTVDSISSAKVNIESVKVSYPVFDFSTHKDIVVKVTYSLQDNEGARDRKTKYYLFSHGSIGNIWSYQYETTSMSYYLNFK